jgi:ABC-type multidrug transport system permease subunit
MIAVFLKDLRLILRDRWALLAAMLAPIVIISLIAGALFDSNDRSRLLLPVADEDLGPVATAFRKLLSEHADVQLMSRAEAEHLVRDENRAPAAIVFPEGLSRAYLRGEQGRIELLTDPAQANGVQAIKVLLLLVDQEAQALADPLSEDLIVVEKKSLTGSRGTVTSFDENVPGFTILFVLLAVVFGTSMALHDERGWGTLPRLLVAPAGFTWMLLGKLGARFVLGFAQMLVLLLWGYFFFRVSLGSSPSALVVVSAAVVFASVALGLVVAGIAGTREQTQPLSLAVVMLFSAVGGLWWPPEVTPEWMRSIAPAVYTSWAMQAMNDLVLRDRGLDAITWPVSMLLLYGLVTLVIGVKLFRARHSAR